MNPNVQVNLSVDVDLLTAGSAAEVVNAILESLLYQRQQIPFSYKTYRYYVNKWLENDKNTYGANEEECGDLANFQLQRQRNQATMTKKMISAMRMTIKDAFERHDIRCVRFLFGSTIFTPKEAYTLHITPGFLSKYHCYEHHRITSAKLNQTLLSLLTSEELYDVFSKNLSPTNIYLELEALDQLSETNNTPPSLFPKELSSIPASCKNIHLNLLPANSDFIEKKLMCCKELEVFEDIINLNLEDANNSSEESPGIANLYSNGHTVWWESEIVVRGFKEKPIKGFNIWT